MFMNNLNFYILYIIFKSWVTTSHTEGKEK